MSPRLFYRTIAIAEAVTWTGLITGILLKYAADADGTPLLMAGSLQQQRLLATAPKPVTGEDLAAVFRGSMEHW